MHTITTVKDAGPLDVEQQCSCGESEQGAFALVQAWAELHLMLTSPEPVLPCPDWCTCCPGHGWDAADVHAQEVSRTHTLDLSGDELPARSVVVGRFDYLDVTTGREVSEPVTLTVDVEGVSGDLVRAVYEAVRAAARLVAQDAR